jgi:hypothetical protein
MSVFAPKSTVSRASFGFNAAARSSAKVARRGSSCSRAKDAAWRKLAQALAMRPTC